MLFTPEYLLINASNYGHHHLDEQFARCTACGNRSECMSPFDGWMAEGACPVLSSSNTTTYYRPQFNSDAVVGGHYYQLINVVGVEHIKR